MNKHDKSQNEATNELGLSGDQTNDHQNVNSVLSPPLEAPRKMLNPLASSLKQYKETLASIADPLKQHRELMASLPDPLKHHREMLASIADPLKEHRELMASLTDPLKQHREMLASMADPLKEHRELMVSLADPLKHHREMLKSIEDPLKSLRSSLPVNLHKISELSLSIEKSSALDYLKGVAFEINAELTIEPNGFIASSAKRIAATELQNLSKDIIQRTSLEPTTSLEDSINNLINEIRSQKDPATQKILMWFIYPLMVAVIVSFINPVVDHYVKAHLNNDKRSLSKQIKKNAKSERINKDILNDLRYVSATKLNVRKSNSKQSDVVGILNFGYSVLVIERNKSWTLIEWNDPNGDSRIKGWVYSRYLEKFM